jgi:hypothetical protein
MQKLSLKSVHVLCKRCRSADKEDNKIGFAFLRFSVILYEFSKPLDLRVKTLRIYFHSDPRKFWNLTDMPLGLAKGSLRVFSLHRCALRRGRGGASSLPARWGQCKQTRKSGCDSAHHKSIGVSASAEESSDERQRRGHDSGAATARNLVQSGAEVGHVIMWGHE